MVYTTCCCCTLYTFKVGGATGQLLARLPSGHWGLFDIPYRVYQLWASLQESDPGEWLLRRRILAELSSKSPEKSELFDLGERRRRLLQDEWALQAALPLNAAAAATAPEEAKHDAAAATAAAAVPPAAEAAALSTGGAAETAEAATGAGAAAKAAAQAAQACVALLSDEALLDEEELVQGRLLEVRYDIKRGLV